MDIALLQHAAQEAGQLLRALANDDRLLLLCQLSQGERSVSELEALTGIRQPTLSQQLGILRQKGLVKTRREGKRIYYQVVDETALAILQVLYQRYCPVPQGDST